MSEIEIERAREAAEDLVDLLSAYELELGDLAQGAPGVAALRDAVGAALDRASAWISDRDAAVRRMSRAIH